MKEQLEGSRDRIGGIVLCGGMSRRMGTSKASLMLEGETLLARTVRIVGSAVSRVVVASRVGRSLPELPGDVEIVHDRRGHEGPLAGLASGLGALALACAPGASPAPASLLTKGGLQGGSYLAGGAESGSGELSAPCDAAFVVPCDHPRLKVELVRRMIELLKDEPGVVIEHEGIVQPLVGVYRLTTKKLLDELLTSGERRAHVFVERCGARVISSEQLRNVDPQLESLRNVNDPDDLRRLGDSA